MNRIPIVLAADENYAPQMYITILSALKSKNTESFYDIFCLLPDRFSGETEEVFFELQNKFENTKIRFIPMNNDFKAQEMQISHISTPTYYRLRMPEILKEYKKAIYLDVDIIVLKDLSEFFNIDIDDYYIAGVKAAGYILDEKQQQYSSSIGIEDISGYVNAGVTLWNLEKIRKDNLCDKLIELAAKNFRSMDQDVINLAFYRKIKILPFRYNLMTKYYDRILNQRELLDKIYGKKEIDEAIDSPVIIHYADYVKPWSTEEVWLKDKWQEIEEESPLKCKIQIGPRGKILREIENGKRIVFWGASLFLKDLIERGIINGDNVLGIVDKNSERHGQKLGKYGIYPPEDIGKLKPDIIISAIKHYNTSIYPQIVEYVAANCPEVEVLPDIFAR